MPSYLSEAIRLTVPISPALSERLSVMAYLNDLTRSQYVRRALDAYIADSMVDWARLADMDVDRWYADACKRWKHWHRSPSIDASGAEPEPDTDTAVEA